MHKEGETNTGEAEQRSQRCRTSANHDIQEEWTDDIQERGNHGEPTEEMHHILSKVATSAHIAAATTPVMRSVSAQPMLHERSQKMSLRSCLVLRYKNAFEVIITISDFSFFQEI